MAMLVTALSKPQCIRYKLAVVISAISLHLRLDSDKGSREWGLHTYWKVQKRLRPLGEDCPSLGYHCLPGHNASISWEASL